jgi:hypothetical protein
MGRRVLAILAGTVLNEEKQTDPQSEFIIALTKEGCMSSVASR